MSLQPLRPLAVEMIDVTSGYREPILFFCDRFGRIRIGVPFTAIARALYTFRLVE
jgi:hypothetical protein